MSCGRVVVESEVVHARYYEVFFSGSFSYRWIMDGFLFRRNWSLVILPICAPFLCVLLESRFCPMCSI